MTHDFAKKPKNERRKKRRPQKTSTKNSSTVPGWVWLLTGIVAGVFISFLGYLADITPEPAPAARGESKPAAKQEPKPAAKDPGTRFDFYTLLPEREVIVPTEQQETTEPEQQYQYILQAGSFKKADDADRLRAKLIMMGMDVRVDAVKGQGGDTWHRVQVGPFTSRSKLSKARSSLIHEGIETLLLKRKLEG
jgi:cell division protein FtsN